MPPRSTASNPNLQVSRKGSVPALSGNASISMGSPSSITNPSRMTVMDRAHALEQLAAAGQQTMIPSRKSPTPVSPFLKNNAIEASFVVSQSSARRPSSAPSEGQDEQVATRGRGEDVHQQEAQLAIAEEKLQGVEETTPGIRMNNEERRSYNTEQLSEEDQAETPRQSTNYNDIPKKVSRQDSSRQANYSLKPQTYSPNLGSEGGRGAPEAPRLPELYFQGDKPELAMQRGSVRENDLQESSLSTYAGLIDQKGGSVTQKIPGSNERGQTTEAQLADDHVDAGDRSFFWPSPHDSTDETDDEDDYTNPEFRESQPTPERHNTLTSATMFGIGRPSDWEHFYGGDYETELIDDTELYLRKKERDKHRKDETRVSNLETTKEDEMEGNEAHLNDQQRVTDSRTREASLLSTIEESRENEDIITPSDLNLENFAESPPPATPAVLHQSPSATESTVLSVRAVSECIPEDGESGPDGTTINPKISRETIVPSEKAGNDPESIHDDLTRTSQAASISEEKSVASSVPDKRLSAKTPPPTEIKMPPSDNSTTGGLASGPSSPPADDPNASEITISMVLPPDFDPPISPQRNLSQAKSSPPLKIADSRKSVFPLGEEQPNPYAGLGPMAKASLNRFIRMLREEEKTEADQDKYYVFVNFTRHELKLRATLYDMDEELDLSVPPSARASMMSTPNRRTGRSPFAQRRSVYNNLESIKSIDPTTGRAQSMIASGAASFSEATTSAFPRPLALLESTKQTSTKKSLGSAEIDIRKFQDNSQKGGFEAMHAAPNSRSVAHQSSLEILNKSIDFVAPISSVTSDTNPSSTLNQSPQAQASESQSASGSPLPGAQILEASLSVRPNESRPYDGDKAINRQSIYRPYSGVPRLSSSHRRTLMESVATIKSAERIQMHKTTETGPRSADTNKTFESRESGRSTSLTSARQMSAADALLAIIPQNNVLREEHRQLTSLRSDMDNIIDDFTFIHRTVLAWDSGAKVKRERYEHERQQRMSENERHVDELFNDEAIGYGDISHLEDEFNKSEAEKKAIEEREEVESFVSSVFDVVWARINYEMDQLTPLYEEATKLVASSSAGKEMFEEAEEKVPIAPIMDVLLVLYQKLMIRHQKAFEAVLERDRRLKKTELSPWFAVGEFEKVKEIEKRFEDAEKLAILEFCKQRDERANLLMDVLDQHTLRGVGANQDYMESVMQAIRRNAVHMVDKANKANGEQSKISTDEVAKAKLVTVALARSSEQIVRTFHVADMLLNAADYEVSVANAKLSNADAAAFKRLRSAKAEEDAKLAADLEHRMELIQNDTSRTEEEVAKLMLIMGHQDSDLKFNLAKEHNKRMVVALSEARARLDIPPPPPEK